MRALARRALALTALALVSTSGPLVLVPPAHAATSRAVIVIGGSTHTISFNGTITGLQALRMVASVETLGYSGQGAAVCRINGTGNPPVSGQCLGESSGEYWSYWRSPPGSSGWSYAGSGAGASTVTDGAVEGWAFGAGTPPPYHSFCSVAGCAPPPPPPSPSVGGAGSVTPGGSAAGEPDGPGQRGSPDGGAGARAEPEATGDEAGDDATTERASRGGGRPNVDVPDDGGNGSTVGVAVAGGMIAGLAGTGLWLRRRRAGA